jgi:hypothetical protein
MIVQLETQLIWYGREYEPGEQIELPDIEAKRFIERGMALPIAAPIEVAALPTYEKGRQHGRNSTTRR